MASTKVCIAWTQPRKPSQTKSHKSKRALKRVSHQRALRIIQCSHRHCVGAKYLQLIMHTHTAGAS
eukprot:1475021-Karenia_brevis.AAC.1